MTEEQIRFLSKTASQVGIVQLFVILYIDLQAKSTNWTMTSISVVFFFFAQIFGLRLMGKLKKYP